MSLISQVIMIIDCSDLTGAQILNQKVAKSQDGQRFTNISNFDGHTSKGFVDIIFAGAFNYLHEDVFVKDVQDVSWYEPEKLTLLINEDNADYYKYYRMSNTNILMRIR